MRLIAIGVLSLSLAIVGCGGFNNTALLSPEQGMAITGNVHGGQQPVAGSHVYLMAANTTGYGNASVSLLNSASTGYSDAIGAYVPTDANGNFSLSGDYTCTPGTQVYTYALGGNPGAGVNSAAGFLAALGACPAAGNLAATVPNVFMNEETTVAAAFAIAGFAVDATHISSSGTTLAQTGIANAFATASVLVSTATGADVPQRSVVKPVALMNTLGNILAACINSSGSSSSICTTLLNNAQSSGSSGTVPTDTATAAINIAHNPGSNISTLYSLAGPTPPFSPGLTAQPNDFTLTVVQGGGSSYYWNPNSLAIDANGYVWTTNLGTSTSPAVESYKGVQGGNGCGASYSFSTQPAGVAIDASGNVWYTDNTGSNLFEITTAGAPSCGGASFTGGGLNSPTGIAISGNGDIWIQNAGIPQVSTFSASGIPYSTSSSTPFGGSTESAVGLAALNLPSVGSSAEFMAVTGSNADVYTWTRSSTSAGRGKQGGSGGGEALGPIAGSSGTSSTSFWLAQADQGALRFGGPADFPVYTGGGLGPAAGLAVDGLGNVWVANVANTLSEFTSAGVPISPSTGYTAGGNLNADKALAIDTSGNVWVATSGNKSITVLIGAAAPVVTPLSVAAANDLLGTRP